MADSTVASVTGRFLQANPDAAESEIVTAARVLLEGDYMYMIGHAVHPVLLPGSIRNHDFAASRYVIPLFDDGLTARVRRNDAAPN